MEIIIPVHSICVGMSFTSLISKSLDALSHVFQLARVPAGPKKTQALGMVIVSLILSVTSLWFVCVFFKSGLMNTEKVKLWGEVESVVCELSFKRIF